MRFYKTAFILLLIKLPSFLSAQGFEFSPSFLKIAAANNLELTYPTENSFSEIPQITNEYLPFVFGMKSKKQDIEIYILYQNYNPENPATQNPQVETSRITANAATNHEESVITVLELGKEYVKESFGADWGREIYFHPKKGLSGKENCRLVTVYKEGIGQLSIFFFFNEKTAYLDSFYNWVRFAPN
ncbi:MAG: hypothetical protein R2769_00410 [Saprospiraceae bacterium]